MFQIRGFRVRTMVGAALLGVMFTTVATLAPQPGLAQDAITVNPDADQYILPPTAIQELFETNKNYATLNYMSPDGNHFVVPLVNELSTLELMSKETYRLAELEIRPQTDRLWHLDTYGIYGLRFYSLMARRFVDVDLPEGSFVSDLTWSPDGSQIAFLAHLTGGTEVWTADPRTGQAQSLSDATRRLRGGRGNPRWRGRRLGGKPSHLL